jgi:hypothetical protein
MPFVSSGRCGSGRHVQGDPALAKQEKNPMSQRELSGIGDAGRKGRQELVRVVWFTSKPAEHGEVDVLRKSGFPPAL